MSGDVIGRRGTGLVELGVGYQISKTALVEFTYAWSGTFQKTRQLLPARPVSSLPTRIAVSRSVEPAFPAHPYAPGGERTEYLKPELSLGVGSCR